MAEYNPVTRGGAVDAFNSDGTFVGRTPFEGTFTHITGRGNKLYVVRPDDNDDIAIHRYRVEGL